MDRVGAGQREPAVCINKALDLHNIEQPIGVMLSPGSGGNDNFCHIFVLLVW